MPFQNSPGRDDGYDISDYYGVNPAYGTLGDFVDFTHAAAQRGIRSGFRMDAVPFVISSKGAAVDTPREHYEMCCRAPT